MATKKKTTAARAVSSKSKQTSGNSHHPAPDIEPDHSIKLAPGASVTVGPLSAFVQDPDNLNDHTPRGHSLLTREIQQNGVGRSILATNDGVIKAGNLTSEVMHEVMGNPEAIIVRSDGTRPIVHVRTDINSADERAVQMGIADNWIASVSMNLSAAALRKLDPAIANRYFFAEELARLLQPGDEVMGQGISGVTHGLPDKRRMSPLDLIFTATMPGTCCMAAGSGFKYGLWSNKKVCNNAILEGPHKVTFMDNDYHAYDHIKHLSLIQRWRPKYATVRDIMSKEQCRLAGIEYYPLDKILTWAAELAQYAQHIILIPKYDCLADIPTQYILGYSIPTSHGGTPLPIELFRERKVHLLGGSWREQLAYLNDLGDAVVSLDNNYISKMAQFAVYTLPDGQTFHLRDTGFPDVVNSYYVALAISMGNIVRKVIDLHDEGAKFKPDDTWADENIQAEEMQ
jgi:hypothetical protein